MAELWRRPDGVEISTDPARLDVAAIHAQLGSREHTRDMPREIVERLVAGSLCFGVYDGPRQIGFGRVVTDWATFAYIGDVYVLEAHRGAGLGTWLMETILGHPGLAGLRRWMLMCGPRAVTLYRRFGFVEGSATGHLMHRTERDLYRRRTGGAETP
ncbi:MAG: GNAT family N-acetyltransferase [Alphaproteobacteria bacterium]